MQVEFHTHSETMHHVRVYHWHAFYESREISALIIWPNVVKLVTSTSVTEWLNYADIPLSLPQLPYLFSFFVLWTCKNHVKDKDPEYIK